jgi:hypothetical protein
MVAYSTTPLAVDLYSRYMAAVFDEKKVISVPTGFQAFYGRPETGAETSFNPDSNDVDIDIVRGTETIAALIPRGTISRPLGAVQKNVTVEQFSSFSRSFPLIEEETDINSSMLLNRNSGENPYERRARITRLRYLAGRAHAEQVRRTMRSFEVLASLSMLDGKMPAIFGTTDTDLIYDWRRATDHNKTLTTQWTDPAADILADIDAGWDKIREDAYVSADYMILGSAAMNAFLVDADVIAKADNRRFELIMVNQEMPVPSRYAFMVAAGFTARGRLLTPGGHEIWMFTYEDVYTDLSGTTQKYMPAGKVIIGYSGARFDRYFGPPELLPDIPMRQQMYQQLFGFSSALPPMPPKVKDAPHAMKPGMFYFDAYASADWKKVTTRAQAAPIFATTQTDALYVILNAA